MVYCSRLEKGEKTVYTGLKHLCLRILDIPTLGRILSYKTFIMGIVSINKKISTGRAKRLVRNFKNHKWDPLSKGIDKDETKSVFFNRRFCDELIRELQQPGIDGLRVYFGSYEKDHKNPNRNGKLTVIFVTSSKGNNVLEDPTEEEKGPQDYEMADQKLDEMNDGAICPPLGCNEDPEHELWPANP